MAISIAPSLDIDNLTFGTLLLFVPWMNWIIGFDIIVTRVELKDVHVETQGEANKCNLWPLNVDLTLGQEEPLENDAKPTYQRT